VTDWRGITLLASRKAWIGAGAIVGTLILAVAVTWLTACSTSSQSTRATPSTDRVLAAYRSKVNDDVNTIDVLEFHKLTCKTRDLCISQLQDIRAATATLVGDLASTTVPTELVRQGAAMQAAAQQLLAHLDEVLITMRQPGSDYVKLSADIDVHPLELASGSVICWPGKPVPNEGGESAVGYVCGR
jgi:hypothetical protein